MTEDSMVERVARAIAEQGGSNWDMCLAAPGQRMAGMYRSMARASIKAMREPTESMIDTALDKAFGNGRALVIEDWGAMIDAALVEKG